MKKETAEDAEDENADGVAGHEAEADGGAHAEPPARVLGAEDARDGVSREDPPEIVERRVGHEAAVEEAEAADSDGGGGDKLGPAPAADGAGGEAGENHRQTLSQGDEAAEAAQRGPEQEQLDAGEERREGRIDDVTPGEVVGVVVCEKFIAMEAVTDVDGDMEQDDGEAEQDQEGCIAETGSRSVHGKDLARSRESFTPRAGGMSVIAGTTPERC